MGYEVKLEKIFKQKIKFFLYAGIISILIVAAIIVNFNSPAPFNNKLTNNTYVAEFTRVYATKEWGIGSGEGSNPSNAAIYIDLLQSYFYDQRFKTIVDLGCGDWQIMNHITIPNDKVYIGYDVVPSLITTNTERFKANNVTFMNIAGLKEFNEINITGDLLVVKDVLQHWPIAEIKYFIKNILPKFKYALITNEYLTDSPEINSEISLGAFRSLNLAAEPFLLKNITEVLLYEGPGQKQVLLYTNPS